MYCIVHFLFRTTNSANCDALSQPTPLDDGWLTACSGIRCRSNSNVANGSQACSQRFLCNVRAAMWWQGHRVEQIDSIYECDGRLAWFSFGHEVGGIDIHILGRLLCRDLHLQIYLALASGTLHHVFARNDGMLVDRRAAIRRTSIHDSNTI